MVGLCGLLQEPQANTWLIYVDSCRIVINNEIVYNSKTGTSNHYDNGVSKLSGRRRLKPSNQHIGKVEKWHQMVEAQLKLQDILTYPRDRRSNSKF